MDFPNSTGENILDQDLVGYLIESGDKVNDNSGNGSEASNKPTSVGFPRNIRQQVLPHMQALPRLLDVPSLRVLHARMCFESGEKTILANPSGLIRGCPLAVPPVIFSHSLPNPAISCSQNLPQILPFSLPCIGSSCSPTHHGSGNLRATDRSWSMGGLQATYSRFLPGREAQPAGDHGAHGTGTWLRRNVRDP